MKMEGMKIVMAKDSVEEVRERGTIPATMLFMKRGVEGTAWGLRLVGANPKRGLSPLVGAV